METSLHRQLKSLYADQDARFEVPLGGYRIDVVRGRRLVEIQHGTLAAIRDKVRALLEGHEVTVVKPIVIRKQLVKLAKKGGRITGRRISPKRGRPVDLFDELIHFTRVFPHPRLTLDVPLVDIQEWRYPGHGRRRRWRAGDYQIEDQKLLEVHQVLRFRRPDDLRTLVGCRLPQPFHTGHLAQRLDVPRWVAQRIAYCFRKMGMVRQVGKLGNTLLYEFVASGQASLASGQADAVPWRAAG